MIKVVSLDIFITLADLNARVPYIWRRILDRDMDEAEAMSYADGYHRTYLPYYHDLAEQPFHPMMDVFRRGMGEYFQSAGIDLDPDRASDIFEDEHNYCPIYPDVDDFIARASKKCRIVLSSDTDCAMVKGLLDKIPHDGAYLSEEIKAYKADKNGAFFKRVVNELCVRPDEILHIGDGTSDVRGAKRAGIVSCLIDRGGHGWDTGRNYGPDHVIGTLGQALDLI